MQEKRLGYVVKNNNQIIALLILKEESNKENYDHLEKTFKPAKRLKISTFKVERTGNKIGKEFMNIIIEEALKRKVEEIYITLYPKYTSLIKLLDKYNFKLLTYIKSEKIDKKQVYVKKLVK